MKKKAFIIAASAALVVLGIALGIILYANSDAVKIRKQLDLGQKYLTELDYEQAIAAYEAVLEIDSRNVDAYIGMSESYVGLGDYESAVEILQTGYELTGDEALKSQCDEYQKILDEIEAEKARQKAEEEAKRRQEQERAEYAVVLKPIYEAIISEDIETAFALMQEEPYLALVTDYTSGKTSQPYYSPENVEFEDMNKGIAVYTESYSTETGESIQSFCYCGDYAAGIREGEGNWLYYLKYDGMIGTYQYSGVMKNDLPNGSWRGHMWWENAPQNHSIETILDGEYTDGVGNGNFTYQIKNRNDNNVFEYIIENGYFKLMSTEPDEAGYYKVADDKLGNSGGFYVLPEDRVYIIGFGAEAGA